MFDHSAMLEAELNGLIGENRRRIGLVADDLPLISNLDVVGNIALIMEYQGNIPRHEAEERVMAYLGRYQLESIARKRNPDLTNQERFCAMLLRAVMVPDVFLVIDRPMKILPDLQDETFLGRVIGAAEDLFEDGVILDYSWNQMRYGWLRNPEN